MSLIDSMQMLKDDIKSSRQKRRQDLRTIKQVTKQLQQDTHKRLADAERARREEAAGERRKLTDFTKDLTQTAKDLKGGVTVLRRGFRQNQKEVRNEILTAGAVWQGKTSVPVKQEKEDKGKKEEEGKKE